MTTYEIITEKIIKKLEAGRIPWKKQWRSQGEQNLVSKKGYRGINLLLLSDSDFSSQYWLTFKQAQDLKGKVKKGEKGTQIVFWKIFQEEDADGGEKDKKIFMLRYYTVFNLDQCEGIEMPKEERNEINPIATCEAIVKGYATMSTLKTNQQDKAFYNPREDFISLQNKNTFRSAEGYYSALFHEMVHSTGHEARLNRFDSKTYKRPFASTDYSKEELIAELGNAYLCAEAGIDNTELTNNAAYIQSWLQALKNDKKLLFSASSQAIKATNYILGN